MAAPNVTGGLSNLTRPRCSQAPESDWYAIVQAVLILFLFVSLGATISAGQIRENIRAPKGLAVSQAGQFLLMPLLGWGFAKAFQLPVAAAVGLVAITTAPGGAISNIVAVVYQADIALSVTATAASSVIAIGAMPLNQYIYLIATKLAPGVCINVSGILLSAVLVVAGTALGVKARPFLQQREQFTALRAIHVVGVASGLAIIVLGFVANLGSNMPITALPRSFILASAVPFVIGTLYGLIVSRLLGLPKPSAVTIALEVGIQNKLVALAVLSFIFPAASPQRAASFAFPIIYAFIATISSFIWVGIAWKLGWTNLPAEKGFIEAFIEARQRLKENRDADIYGEGSANPGFKARDGKVADSASTLANPATQDLEAANPSDQK